jgi:hypothetical protein
MSSTATYTYCVVHREKRPGTLGSVEGVPGASALRVDPFAPSLWLVTAAIPIAEYDAQVIQRRLQDLEWVSQIAVAHQNVVERFTSMSGATVIPMKLLTLFSSLDRAIENMRQRRRQLDGIAKRLRGNDEWGVRIIRQPVAPSTSRTQVLRPASGVSFLAAKKRARDEALAQAASAAEVAERAVLALGRFARETRRQPPPEGATSPPLVNAALLVPSTRKVRFRAAVRREARRCREAGADLTLTGPWPAYNFIEE